MTELNFSYAGSLGQMALKASTATGQELSPIKAFKNGAEFVSRIATTILADLEALFCTVFGLVTIPLQPLFPEKYAHLTAHTQTALRAIKDNLYGEIYREKQQTSVGQKLKDAFVDFKGWAKDNHKLLIGGTVTVGVGLFALNYFRFSPLENIKDATVTVKNIADKAKEKVLGKKPSSWYELLSIPYLTDYQLLVGGALGATGVSLLSAWSWQFPVSLKTAGKITTFGCAVLGIGGVANYLSEYAQSCINPILKSTRYSVFPGYDGYLGVGIGVGGYLALASSIKMVKTVLSLSNRKMVCGLLVLAAGIGGVFDYYVPFLPNGLKDGVKSIFSWSWNQIGSARTGVWSITKDYGLYAATVVGLGVASYAAYHFEIFSKMKDCIPCCYNDEEFNEWKKNLSLSQEDKDELDQKSRPRQSVEISFKKAKRSLFSKMFRKKDK